MFRKPMGVATTQFVHTVSGKNRPFAPSAARSCRISDFRFSEVYLALAKEWRLLRALQSFLRWRL